MTPKPITENTLFYGDNLLVLREYIGDETIDLVYLDPPFNSNRDYNVLFRDESGTDSEAQIVAFEDTWHWGPTAEETYYDVVTHAPERVASATDALRELIGTNQMMAYLVMMTARLIELHRVLKPTGSLWLHCDPTASHYLKVILDTIFSPSAFINEVIWKRTSAHSDVHQGAIHMGRIHDVILYYAKPEHRPNTVYTEYSEDYIADQYRHVDPETGRRFKTSDMTGPGGAAKGNPQYEVLGVTRYWRYSEENMNEFLEQGRIYQSKPGNVPRLKQYLDEMPGIPLQDIWDDVSPIGAHAKERLGYPTQKPQELLERIVEIGTDPGEIVLDPFCGCGTAIAAAERQGRRWIGIDITHLSIALQKYRLQDMFDDPQFRVIGEPTSISGAYQLAEDNRFQFEWWALSLVRAKPTGGTSGSRQGKKGSDRGIDGVINFIDDASGKLKQVLVQVKSGKINTATIRDLRGTVEREEAEIGVLITLEEPTQPMITEAVSAGYYKHPHTRETYPRIQILTIEKLLHEETAIEMPPDYGTFKQAQRETRPEDDSRQLGLDM